MPASAFLGRLLALVAAVLVAVQYAYVFKAAIQQASSNSVILPLLACVQSGKGGKPVGSHRDCSRAQGPECTLREPCTPCDADGGCVACARGALAGAVTGECAFVLGVGPYCRDPATSVVEPCRKCCSG